GVYCSHNINLVDNTYKYPPIGIILKGDTNKIVPINDDATALASFGKSSYGYKVYSILKENIGSDIFACFCDDVSFNQSATDLFTKVYAVISLFPYDKIPTVLENKLFFCNIGSSQNPISTANAINNKRVLFSYPKVTLESTDTDDIGCVFLAVLSLKKEKISFNGYTSDLSESEKNSLLYNGVSVFEKQYEGYVNAVRVVTSCSLDENKAHSDSFLDVSTVIAIDEILATLKSCLQNAFLDYTATKGYITAILMEQLELMKNNKLIESFKTPAIIQKGSVLNISVCVEVFKSAMQMFLNLNFNI
ncbi:MAG: hypothetical protein RSE07_04785, partial [Oscillospiraceae bacterium]